jgi:hypothetical protein
MDHRDNADWRGSRPNALRATIQGNGAVIFELDRTFVRGTWVSLQELNGMLLHGGPYRRKYSDLYRVHVGSSL